MSQVRSLIELTAAVLILGACSSGAVPDESSPTTTPGLSTITSPVLPTTPTTSNIKASTTSVAFEPVGLVPTGPQLRADCESASRLLGFEVPCPTLLPATTRNVRCEIPPDFASAEISPKVDCALGESFILAPQWIKDPEIEHLIIEAALSPREGCEESSSNLVVAVNGNRARLMECPPLSGLLSDHILLRWEQQGVFIDVSVHGHSDYDKAVVTAIARGIVLVSGS